MSYGITVNTGGAAMRRWSEEELVSFFRNTGVMRAALENMKGSVRGLRSGIQGATRCLGRMGSAVRGVLSGLMDARSVADGLRTGMKSLQQYSRVWWKSFSGTLSSLAANATYLRNSLAAMAAPLLQALSPAIEHVTDQFVGLFNLINQFFARLTGASTYVAARRAAGGIDSVGRSASLSANSVEELKRQLADFDELNVLSAPKTPSGSGGSGGSGSGGGVQFEQRQIESSLAAFVDALKAAFQAGDWQELGTLIGGKINELIDSVDWAAAGAKVGYYVNGLFSTLYWTLDTVNFTNIGASVAEFLNNALAEIDFSTVGGTVALLFTSLAETIAGFVDEFDWAQFAEKLADGVNGFMSTLGERLSAIDWGDLALKLTDGLNAFIARTDWDTLGATFGGRVNDLLAILGTASANFDWKGAGDALARSVNGLLKSVDWEGMGKWLNDTLLGVLDLGIAFFEGFDAAGFAENLEKALSQVDWDGVSQKLWQLFKAALQNLGELAGTLLFGGSADLKLNLGLLKDGWDTIAAWLGIDDPLSALVGLVKDNWRTIAAWLGVEDPVSAAVALSKNGWTSIGDFVGTAVTVLASLGKKDANQTPGVLFDVATALGFKGTLGKKDGNQAPGTVFNVSTALGFLGTLSVKDKNDASTKFKTGTDLGFTGTLGVKDKNDASTKFKTGTDLGFTGKMSVKDKNDAKTKFKTGTELKFSGKLKAKNQPKNVFDKSVSVEAKATLAEKSKEALRSAATKAMKGITVTVKAKSDSGGAKMTTQGTGGVTTNAGILRRFASGGVIRGGLARYLEGVPHYAGGTTRAHGTVFVAGEAGPEIMGHLNGRTEILNKSQLAQTMYSAVVSAMTQAVSALGTFLSGQLATCTNAVVATIGNREQEARIRWIRGFAQEAKLILTNQRFGKITGSGNRNGWAWAGLEYHAPVMATGTVLPYEVAAQVARSGADIQNTLNANNEDLIQAIVSVAGQIVAAVQASGRNQQNTTTAAPLTAQQIIDDINRRTQMFGGSPLLG